MGRGSRGYSGTEQTEIFGQFGRLDTTPHSQFVINVLHVPFYRPLREIELAGDFLVALSGIYHLK